MKKEQRSKVLGLPITKSHIEKSQDGSVMVRAYFTSDNRDEVGDIITRAATERALAKYRQWANIRYMHQPRPVGKAVKIGSEDGLEWNEVEIKVIDPQAAFEVEQGLLTALSVGILIEWEDIDMMEDGGWIINDYQLAEISLVDHPANYDAKLKDLPVDEGLRLLARNHGVASLARSMQVLLDRENAMETQPIEEQMQEEEKALPEEPEVEKSAEESALPEKEAEMAEETKAEEAPVEEAPAEEEQPEAEESQAEEETAQEEEPVAEEEPEAEEEPVDALSLAISELTSQISRFELAIDRFLKSLEVKAEVPNQEQADDVAEEDKSMDDQEAEPEEPQGEPVRKGAVPASDAVDQDVDQQERIPALRQALTRYLSNHK